MGFAKRRFVLLIAAAASATLIATTTGVGAIMTRHDLPDSDYIIAADTFPAVVDLLDARGDCLGTLIAPGWIITAAHCAEDIPAVHEISVADLDRPVEGVVCHPDYDGFDDDIALVHLVADVTSVPPMPVHRGRDEEGADVLFVGRGDHGTGRQGQIDASNDHQTRMATNTVHDVDSRWLEFVFHEPGDAEVTDLEGISGDGDSGGPALLDTPSGYEVAGLSSWQDARRRKVGTYGVHDYYTRVSSYVDFIDETTGVEWDGEYRNCSGCGCRAAGSGSGESPAIPAALALGSALSIWRRRRAA